MSSVLTCPAVSSSALLVPLDTLPKILLLVTEIELGEILLVPNLPVGTVPVVNALAFKSVRAPPPTAGNVVGNLPFGIVPIPRLLASSDVKFVPLISGRVPEICAAGMLVKPIPEP